MLLCNNLITGPFGTICGYGPSGFLETAVRILPAILFKGQRDNYAVSDAFPSVIRGLAPLFLSFLTSGPVFPGESGPPVRDPRNFICHGYHFVFCNHNLTCLFSLISLIFLYSAEVIFNFLTKPSSMIADFFNIYNIVPVKFPALTSLPGDFPVVRGLTTFYFHTPPHNCEFLKTEET